MNSTTLALGLILFGALLLYAAWTKRSVRRLVLGDSTPGTGGYS
jgi:hypothetical protein